MGKLFEAVNVLCRAVIQHRQVIEEILVALGIWNGTSSNNVPLWLLLGRHKLWEGICFVHVEAELIERRFLVWRTGRLLCMHNIYMGNSNVV